MNGQSLESPPPNSVITWVRQSICRQRRFRFLAPMLLLMPACGSPWENQSAPTSTSPTGRWIVALRPSTASRDSHQLSRRFAKAVAEQDGLTGTVAAQWAATTAQHFKPTLIPAEAVGLNVAVFDTQSVGMSTMLGQFAGKLRIDKVLQSMPDVLWVEPDREHEVPLNFSHSGRSYAAEDLEEETTEGPPDYLPQGSQFEPWRRIKLDKALSYVREHGIEFRPVTVAVLDTGVDSKHPDLADRMFENPLEKSGLPNVDDDGNGYTDDLHGADATLEPGQKDSGPDPDPGWADLGGPGHTCPFGPGPDSRSCGHGTHVAGIIAAKPRPNTLTRGICDSCRILSLRVTKRIVSDEYEYDGPIADSAQIRAMAYILQLRDPTDQRRLLVNIINMSLGKYFQSRTLAYLMRQLTEHNVLVVAAAGNDDTDTASYPAAYSSAISVCALGSDGDNFRSSWHRGKFGKATFSNFGEWVDICAPGTDILSTVPSDGTVTARESRSGTSQATPFVAGSLGFLLSIAKGGAGTDAGEALRYLLDGADSRSIYEAKYNKGIYEKKLPDGYVMQALGAGIVDLYNSTLLSQGDSQGRKTSSPGNTAPRVEGCVFNSAGYAPSKGASTSMTLLIPLLWAANILLRRTSAKRRLTTFLAAIGLSGCGAPPRDRSPLRPMEAIKNPIPSEDNAPQWRSLWDGQSWIVAWSDSGRPLQSTEAKNRILQGLTNSAPGTLYSKSVEGDVRHEMLNLTGHGRSEGVGAFSFVRIRDRSPAWMTLLDALTPQGIPGLSRFESYQWNAMNRVPGALWAEPDLENQLHQTSQNYNLPPEMTQSQFARVIRRIRADVAWEKSTDADGIPMYEYGRHSSASLAKTNIAVIDTGVDWRHEDLWDDDSEKSRIFQNPREQINCQDDDGNGYIDDLYGIDATVEMDEWNAAALKACRRDPPTVPEPGSAEVGGSGYPCPPKPSSVTKANCGHGTHVAGIIAAKHGGQQGSFGVCPSCRIVPMRVADLQIVDGRPTAGRIDDSSQIRALSYILGLVEPNTGTPYIRIINMSLGKYFISRSLSFWYRRLMANDILVVAAAGNDDTDTPNYPAAYDPVLAVCATSEDESNEGRGVYAKTGFSNFGSWVDICAPGWDIWSTIPGGGAERKSGTSQAAPIVAGAAGFLKSVHPSYSAKQVAQLLQAHANAQVLYHFGATDTRFPEGATRTNARNRLYEGWLDSGIQYYMLGTGFLDVEAAVTEGRECWDTAAPAKCASYVFKNRERNLQSQIQGGCVFNSVANSRGDSSTALASMPFVMLVVYLTHCALKRARNGRRSHVQI